MFYCYVILGLLPPGFDLFQDSETPTHEGDGSIMKRVVPGFHPLEGVPVHPLRFIAVIVQDSGFPSQPAPDRVRSPKHPVYPGFVLTSIGQSVTIPTRENARVPQIEQSHPPQASLGRAEEPCPLPSEGAIKAGNRWPVGLPFSKTAKLGCSQRSSGHEGRTIPRAARYVATKPPGSSGLDSSQSRSSIAVRSFGESGG
jgi:hypothetical protein